MGVRLGQDHRICFLLFLSILAISNGLTISNNGRQRGPVARQMRGQEEEVNRRQRLWKETKGTSRSIKKMKKKTKEGEETSSTKHSRSKKSSKKSTKYRPSSSSDASSDDFNNRPTSMPSCHPTVTTEPFPTYDDMPTYSPSQDQEEVVISDDDVVIGARSFITGEDVLDVLEVIVDETADRIITSDTGRRRRRRDSCDEILFSPRSRNATRIVPIQLESTGTSLQVLLWVYQANEEQCTRFVRQVGDICFIEGFQILEHTNGVDRKWVRRRRRRQLQNQQEQITEEELELVKKEVNATLSDSCKLKTEYEKHTSDSYVGSCRTSTKPTPSPSTVPITAPSAAPSTAPITSPTTESDDDDDDGLESPFIVLITLAAAVFIFAISVYLWTKYIMPSFRREVREETEYEVRRDSSSSQATNTVFDIEGRGHKIEEEVTAQAGYDIDSSGVTGNNNLQIVRRGERNVFVSEAQITSANRSHTFHFDGQCYLTVKSRGEDENGYRRVITHVRNSTDFQPAGEDQPNKKVMKIGKRLASCNLRQYEQWEHVAQNPNAASLPPRQVRQDQAIGTVQRPQVITLDNPTDVPAASPAVVTPSSQATATTTTSPTGDTWMVGTVEINFSD